MEKFEKLTTLVMNMLREKRVGFLWKDEPLFFPRTSGFAWIHYCCCAKARASAWRVYDLRDLKNPLAESNTLDMLVIPSGSVELLLEVASGFTISPASFLVDGALRVPIPVLFVGFGIGEWIASSGAARDSVERVVDVLRARGMEFIGLPDEGRKETNTTQRGLATFSCGGWLSWHEIAPRVAGCALVRLSGGTKVTPEAADRLAQSNIRVEEVF
ncbi:MAG: hypothetical protein LBQ42_02005 [Synergistaceae bacterium]|jgi:hypothetical protein|nr:hypothetical protein [Synergistaceae bacterium]